MKAALADFGNALREYLGLDPLWLDGRWAARVKPARREKSTARASRRRNVVRQLRGFS